MHVGRQDAQERCAWVVAGARSGAGRALLVVGEPGAGKTTLLDQALAADAAVVLRCTGVPVEKTLPHSGLHALLRPLAGLLPALPGVQRVALEVALGLAAGPAPTPFLVGAAVLSLLAAQAEQSAVVVVADDAQWIDEASVNAVAFAARRLGEERIGMLLAARCSEVPEALTGLPRCELGPLSADEAARVVGAPVAPELLASVRGNALALVEGVYARPV